MNNTINTPKSSALSSLTYDENRKDLTVKFKSGKLYVYTPVSQQFFNKHIKNNEALTCLKLIK